MPRHSDNNLSFDVPRDWDDRTIVAYSAKSDGDAPAANIVVMRDRLAATEDLERYVSRHVAGLEQKLDKFVLQGRRERQIAGRPGLSVSFCSGSGDERLIQQLNVARGGQDEVLTITLTAPQADLAQLVPLFERMIKSVQWHDQGASD